MHPDWVRSVRDQCAAAGVPFLFKQWGEWRPDTDWCSTGTNLKMLRVGKAAAGNVLDGRVYETFPQPR
jgi:protein gp37